MKKLFLSAVAVILFSSNIASAREQISIVGSSTVYPFSSTVAEKFGQQNQFKSQSLKAQVLVGV